MLRESWCRNLLLHGCDLLIENQPVIELILGMFAPLRVIFALVVNIYFILHSMSCILHLRWIFIMLVPRKCNNFLKGMKVLLFGSFFIFGISKSSNRAMTRLIMNFYTIWLRLKPSDHSRILSLGGIRQVWHSSESLQVGYQLVLDHDSYFVANIVLPPPTQLQETAEAAILWTALKLNNRQILVCLCRVCTNAPHGGSRTFNQ